MNKNELVQALKQQLEKDLLIIKQAALKTYEDATHEENKPENKYDTRALEASYLAGAQAQRVKDIEELISICKFLQIKNFNETDGISASALVEVSSNDKTSWLFFLPKGGGFFVTFADKKIQIITPASPLGKSLLGLTVGDTAKVETNGKRHEYDIVSIC
ncbi:MAG: GreA/GreB family elongation factor [Pseudobdellovibrio sp.]